VFRTGGTIALASNLWVTNPFLTVAGQTAPGGGIQLKHYGIQSIQNGAHDLIIRYLRIRPGTANPAGISGAIIGGLVLWGNYGQQRVYNVMVDHVDMEWAIDENASAWEWVEDATIQWSIMAEGSLTGHPDGGSHSDGLLVGGDDRSTVSVHHSLFAHNDFRNPRVTSGALVDFRNNVVYNWGGIAPAGFTDHARTNFVNNHYLPGPTSSPSRDEVLWLARGAKAYVEGNWGPRCPTGCPDGWDIGVIEGTQAQNRALTPFPAPAVTTNPTAQVRDMVLAHAGATLPTRDAVDARIMQDVRNGTGHTGIGSGYPVLAAGTPPPDSDHDGMPDAWEAARGLNPSNAADGPAVTAGGYTNLEHYLSELAGDSVPVDVPGDLNGDRQVTLADLRMLIRMLTGQVIPNDAAKTLAEPTTQLTLADARELVHLLVID
jgi:hypothetical protein